MKTRLTHTFNGLEHVKISNPTETQQKTKLLLLALCYPSNYTLNAEELKKRLVNFSISNS